MTEKCHFDQTNIYHQDTKDTKDFTKNPRWPLELRQIVASW